MKNYIITQNILKMLLLDNTFENYSTNLDKYKKIKYFCNYFYLFKSSRIINNNIFYFLFLHNISY